MKKSSTNRFNWLESATRRSSTTPPEVSEQESKFSEGYLEALETLVNKSPFGHEVASEFKANFSPTEMYATLTDPVIRKSPLELLDLKDAAQAAIGVEALQSAVRDAVGAKASEGHTRFERHAPETMEDLMKEHQAAVVLRTIDPPEDNPYFKAEFVEYAAKAKELGEALSPMADYVLSVAEVKNLADMKNSFDEPAPDLDARIADKLQELSANLEKAGFTEGSTYLKGEADAYASDPDGQKLIDIRDTLFRAYTSEKERVLDNAGQQEFVAQHEHINGGFVEGNASSQLANKLSEDTIAPSNSSLGAFVETTATEPSPAGILSANLMDIGLVANANDKEYAIVNVNDSLSTADVGHLRTILGDEAATKYSDEEIKSAISPNSLVFAQAAEVGPENLQEWVEAIKLDELDKGKDPNSVDPLTVLSASLEYLNDKDFYSTSNLNLDNVELRTEYLPNISIQESETENSSEMDTEVEMGE